MAGFFPDMAVQIPFPREEKINKYRKKMMEWIGKKN